MHDREWVIEGLEFTLQESGWDANAAYDQELMIQVVTEAIALLKAQEPVKPIIETTYGTAECEDPWGRLIFCGACGKRINEKYNPDEDDKYCKHCGKPVKWE